MRDAAEERTHRAVRISRAFANLIRYKQSYNHFYLIHFVSHSNSRSFIWLSMWIRSVSISPVCWLDYHSSKMLLSIFILRMAKCLCGSTECGFDLWAENVHTYWPSTTSGFKLHKLIKKTYIWLLLIFSPRERTSNAESITHALTSKIYQFC